MTDDQTITVANVSAGPGGAGHPGTAVSLPVVELLTGRGFITGKSGSGKSNTASVVAEKLLDNGFGLLIVDIDGEYYGLKEEYEILHVGADDECDIRVETDHAEKLASLALEQNVPIILDVSSFIDEDEAEALLTAVAQHLFSKAKKVKQPFLVLCEEVHEYIPENGSVGEAGKMLIKIGKRGRKHGLGICGISQRPADVKKDFITQCDWMVWHRLTWDNDTSVVRRVLDGEFAGAVEDLGDGEGFLHTDWADHVRRVQFQRKRTFDAGATPGLGNVDRPELKSVSRDLVAELQEISEEKAARDDRINELREELDQKNSRIAELETELQDARDLSRMAEQFTEAMLDQVEDVNPGRTERAKQRERRDRTADDRSTTYEPAHERDDSPSANGHADSNTAETNGQESEADDGGFDVLGFADAMNDQGTEGSDEPDHSDPASAGSGGTDTARSNGHETTDNSAGASDADMAAAFGMFNDDAADGGTVTQSEGPTTNGRRADEPIDPFADAVPGYVRQIAGDLAAMESTTRTMLEFYRDEGPGTPLNAHFAAGGSGDRTKAYARNRRLRTRGLVEHVGRGKYAYCLRALLEEEADGSVPSDRLDHFVAAIEDIAFEAS
jgi:TolA-binding protein